MIKKIVFASYHLVLWPFKFSIKWIQFYLLMITAFLLCLFYRFKKNKKYDIGLGPLPLINNIYHKKALGQYGYSSYTFTTSPYMITSEFDLITKRDFSPFVYKHFFYTSLLIHVLRNYRCIYIYFNGGVFGSHPFLWSFEPILYKLAKIKVVVMSYGIDVQEMTRSTNLIFKNVMAKDYHEHKFSRKITKKKIDLWTRHASHIIAGCDWVNYLYHWDTLMLAHFSIDTERWKPQGLYSFNEERVFKILHAPNHKNIKGSKHFIRVVKELKEEGLPVELVILEKTTNSEIRKIMETVDVVADQLIVGWYAMFALEAMSLEKPVLCYINQDLENLYIEEGLIEPGELPIIRCTPFNIKEVIKNLYINRKNIPQIGKRSRAYTIKHHSIEYVGSVFNNINKEIGIYPKT